METREEIGRWYDEFAVEQVRTSVNLRHFRIMGFLNSAGLTRRASVLEIGCGIGTLTGLLARYLTKGKVVAVDISPESVSIARKRLAKASNVSFIVSDMTDFSYPDLFDFIVLPDVLEHIPLSQHKDLFRTLAGLMHDMTVIMIHIPHPRALDYIRSNHPDQLQIIDQSIEASELVANAYAADLVLVSYLSYSLFDREHDYAVVTFKKKTPLTLSPLPGAVIIARKLKARIRFILSRL